MYGEQMDRWHRQNRTNVPEDEFRRFIITYYKADRTVVVREPPKRNSGIMGGNFLSRMKVTIHRIESDHIRTWMVPYSPYEDVESIRFLHHRANHGTSLRHLPPPATACLHYFGRKTCAVAPHA